MVHIRAVRQHERELIASARATPFRLPRRGMKFGNPKLAAA
jgi:hypothetical protein